METVVEEWHWGITTRCNLSCLHCINNCSALKNAELTAKEALRAVRIMAHLGCRKLMITGGEPLTAQSLPIILKECREKDIGIQFLTNGILIDSVVAKQMALVAEAAGVSLDGSSAEINDFIRGQGSFEKARRAIKLLANYMSVSVYFTVSGVNFNDIKKTMNLAWSLGASKVHISEVVIAGRALANRRLFELSEEQKSCLYQFAKQATGSSNELEKKCNADLSSLYVDSAGTVYPCTEVALYYPSLTLGHITRQDLRQRLEKRKTGFLKNLGCSYRIYAGNSLVFSLKSKSSCSLIEKARQRNDKDTQRNLPGA